MSAKAFTAADAEAANLALVGEEKGRQAVHDLVTAYRANRRSGTAHTKTRGEVRGNNKKIYKQKGTGNARHGDKRAPIFVGGGVVFGPRNRSYAKSVPKSVRKLAMRRVLGDLTRAEKIFTVDSFAVSDGKTKSFLASLKNITEADRKVLLVGNFDDSTKLAARNVAWTQLVTPSDLNVEQLLLARVIILVGDSVSVLAQRTA
ncbi:MAG: 50S ribosomal protein L4 [Akkermansiaceae bacterium]|jgi:large subunit ribosomal protein L4|nr:50S ribosomal protein L4 [Akkermansiaceae bacterium]MDP4646261.1 50S ribosomal protein L4 [Akkermansiaceae bacterium]MDP4720257.1 50S ribosomal protein L4 [Akkermansiaceae bacterium]MDP4779898.1 50S ribosomal protein L4 [Akkermansiaceae bacterium]MDP4845865.1 50S ribosomal protein L4 [Akkermansiaceae bacterium]